jgi:small-conductance mechanosensitive channel
MNSQELHDLLRELTSPGALTELAVLAGCLGLSWLLCAGLRRMLKMFHVGVLFGKRIVDGVLFPVLALLLAVIARELLAGEVGSAVFKLAIPILFSLLLIRLAVRVLSASFPHSAWARAFERTFSWLAWICVVLWITGVLPKLLAQMDTVRWNVGKSTISLRSLLEGGATALIVMVLALWLSAAIERKIIRGTGEDLSLRKIAANLVRVVLLFIGLLIAMSTVGVDISTLSVLGGALGVGLGFGMQKIAANYVSGFIVLAERMLRIGDMVKVDGFEGRITDIRTRYTVLRALSGREAIVPNETLITQRVENVSLMTVETQVLIGFSVVVASGTDVRALQPQLMGALAAQARVLKQPAPQVLLLGFVPGGMEIGIRYWLDDPNNDQDNVKSTINLALFDVLAAANVQFNAPQRLVIEGGTSAAPAPR